MTAFQPLALSGPPLPVKNEVGPRDLTGLAHPVTRRGRAALGMVAPSSMATLATTCSRPGSGWGLRPDAGFLSAAPSVRSRRLKCTPPESPVTSRLWALLGPCGLISPHPPSTVGRLWCTEVPWGGMGGWPTHPVIFGGLRFWYSRSSTVHTAPLTFSTRTKHLCRLRLCRTAFWGNGERKQMLRGGPSSKWGSRQEGSQVPPGPTFPGPVTSGKGWARGDDTAGAEGRPLSAPAARGPWYPSPPPACCIVCSPPNFRKLCLPGD